MNAAACLSLSTPPKIIDKSNISSPVPSFWILAPITPGKVCIPSLFVIERVLPLQCAVKIEPSGAVSWISSRRRVIQDGGGSDKPSAVVIFCNVFWMKFAIVAVWLVFVVLYQIKGMM